MREPDNESERYLTAGDIATVEDQRVEFRRTGCLWVSVEIEAPGNGTAARFVRCCSSDLSGSGLRLKSPEPLPYGTILPIVIHLHATSYHLLGEVKWCFPGEDRAGAQFVGGVALQASSQTSMQDWKEALARLLSP